MSSGLYVPLCPPSVASVCNMVAEWEMFSAKQKATLTFLKVESYFFVLFR